MPTTYHTLLACQMTFYTNNGIDKPHESAIFMRMARTSLNNNYGFPLDRGVITPRPKGLSDDNYLIVALREGYALLAAEAKAASPNASGKKTPTPTTSSVKPTPDSNSVTPAQKLEDTLAMKSTNPYVRAKHSILTKMLPGQRSVIEKMEAGTLDKDARYDMFLREITALGDKISNIKP